ncbi:MAG: stage II sporulation protein M [Chloroflexi bacterium]|nr:stage II sporulation protein M [Chloroflexota bacterium]
MLGYYARLFTSSRRWLLIAAALFVLGMAVGLAFGISQPDLSRQRLELAMTELRANVGPIEAGTWTGVSGIFLNNVRASAIVLAASLFFGLMAGFGLIANGVLLGLLMGVATMGVGRVPWYFVPVGILPHGVIEIPAFLIVGAWGLRLGLRWLAADAAGRRWQVWLGVFGETLRLAPLLILLFGVAAMIEVMVTGLLLRGLAPL